VNRAEKLIVGLSCAGLLWCVAVGFLLWFLPLGSSSSASSSGAVVEDGGQSFASISSLGPLPLIVPVVLVAIAVWSAFRRHRRVLLGATILVTLFSLLTGFSIGLAYLPAVAALVAASIGAFSAAGRPSRVGAGLGRDV
jgi:hypothetical protein